MAFALGSAARERHPYQVTAQQLPIQHGGSSGACVLGAPRGHGQVHAELCVGVQETPVSERRLVGLTLG